MRYLSRSGIHIFAAKLDREFNYAQQTSLTKHQVRTVLHVTSSLYEDLFGNVRGPG